MSPSQDDKYSEKVWTRADGQIDGYVFKGKRSFAPALEGLKGIMQKGKINEVENVKFKPLDVNLRGVGLEIVVEVSANKTKGQAMLKVYGPKEDLKKENSVTITKIKESDSKFVLILAEKVIKPLMDGFLSGERKIAESFQNTAKSASIKGKKFKCSFCDKLCKSSSGLKGHITKKHLNFQQPENEDGVEVCSKKRKQEEEINEVVESIISNVIHSEEKVTLEEDVDEGRKYTKMCNSCDFQVEANKNYISVQKILKHRDSCSLRVSCFQCDLKFKDQTKMKKHMRDVHGQSTNSLSPPNKKKKADEVLSNKDIIDLSESIEEMEVDNYEKEENVLRERSKLMDEKVIKKQKKNDEEIENYLKKKENAPKDTENIKVTKQAKTKNILKQKKQMTKTDKNVNATKYESKNLKEVPENCKHLVNKGDLVYTVPGDGACGPNSAAAHLFQDEGMGPILRKKMNAFFAKMFYKKYQFKTPCSPDSPFKRRVKNKIVEFTDPEELINFLKTSDDAMYMWSDSEDLTIIADMYQMRIKIITTKRAHDANPVVNWIHPDEDLAEEAELQNVEIQDMILLHENDIHFNLIVSEDSLLATMGSLSRNDISNKFEKEVIKEHKEAEKLNEKEINNHKNDYEEENKSLKEQLEEYVKQNGKLRDENVECKNKLKYIEKEYTNCEKELRKIIEENEKDKIVIKDLRKIIDLRQEVNEKENDDMAKSESILFALKTKGFQRIDPQTESSPKKGFECKKCSYKASGESHLNNHIKLIHGNKCDNQASHLPMVESNMRDNSRPGQIKCRICAEVFRDQTHMSIHMKMKHELNSIRELEFNCMECAYQGHSKFQLEKHMKLKHENKGEAYSLEGQIKCRICAEVFEEKANLMIHRKIKHTSLVAQCKNYEERTCTFTPESCWWIHGTNLNRFNNVQCYICSETFKTKSDMMRHRKQYHASMIKLCEKFLQGKCPFQDQFCWFIHSQTKTTNSVTRKNGSESIEDAMETEENSDFQEQIEKTKPPSNKINSEN